MTKATSNLPRRFEKRWGGTIGVIVFGGIPFTAGGIVLLVYALRLLSDTPASRDGGDIILKLVGGVVFTLIGVILLVVRSGVVVDADKGKIVLWTAFHKWIWWKRTHDLAAYRSVTITAGKHQPVNFHVRLEGGPKALLLDSVRTWQQAMKTAEEAALVCRMRIVDRSEKPPKVIEASAVGTSVREQLRMAKDRAALPEPPGGLKTCCTADGERMILDIPPGGFTRGKLLMAVLGGSVAAFSFAFGVLFFGSDWLWFLRVVSLPEICFILVGVVGLLMMAVGILESLVTHARVVVSPELLRVEPKGFLVARPTEIPSSELKQLAVRHLEGRKLGTAKCIEARSDSVVVRFGEGLPEPEMRWICAVLKRVVSV